jgi:hypothetical protein
MKFSEIIETLLAEIRVFYIAKPKDASMKKIKVVARKMNKLTFTEDDVIDYVDFCYKKLKKVKEVGKRSSVDYFIGILASDGEIGRFLDFKKAKGELKSESTTEDTEDDDILKVNGLTYHKIMSDQDRDIFLCPVKIKFMIRDCSRFVPKLYTLNQYNELYPEKKITYETIKPLIKEGKLCLT